LRERVASSLQLSPAEGDSPAGRALLNDTRRVVARLDVAPHFRLHLVRRQWVPVLALVAAVGVVGLFANRTATAVTQSQPDPLVAEQRENVSKNLRERLAEKRKLAEEKQLVDATQLFNKLDRQLDELARTPQATPEDTLVKLSDLADELAQRQQQVGGEKELRRQLAKLGKPNQGPAKKLTESMKQGQWQDAADELQNLQQQLATGKLDTEAQQKLGQQLHQMQDKLQAADRVAQQATEKIKQQLQKESLQGNLDAAKEIQQQLDKIEKQQSQQLPLRSLGNQLGKLSESLQSGKQGQASQALDQMQQQMRDLERQQQESQMLSESLSQLQQAKSAMACQQCKGEGCETCQQSGNLPGSRPGQEPGSGIGTGTDNRPRSVQDLAANFQDATVPQQVGPGSAVVAGEAEGPNQPGQTSLAIQKEMASLGSSPADPQVVEQLPPSRREHVEEYFNTIRTGN
jgi:hypothetical protein